MGQRIDAATVIINVDTNASKAKAELNTITTKTLPGMGAKFKEIAQAIVGPLAIGAAIKGVIELGKATIQAASDAEETQNKFSVVFSSISKTAQAAADNLAANFGLSSRASQQLLSDTGDLLTGFGFTQERALQLSDQVAQLGVDLASFTNYSGGAEGAVRALTSGLLGEREQMKQLGIAITEADIQRLAKDRGIVGELDRQTKAALTLELALSQSKNAIGDFDRSSDSFANTQRKLQAASEDLAATWGSVLLPVATTLAKSLTDIANFLSGKESSDRYTQALVDKVGVLLQRFKDVGEVTKILSEQIGISRDRAEDLVFEMRDMLHPAVRGILSDFEAQHIAQQNINRAYGESVSVSELIAANNERIAVAQQATTDELVRQQNLFKTLKESIQAAYESEIKAINARAAGRGYDSEEDRLNALISAAERAAEAYEEAGYSVYGPGSFSEQIELLQERLAALLEDQNLVAGQTENLSNIFQDTADTFGNYNVGLVTVGDTMYNLAGVMVTLSEEEETVAGWAVQGAQTFEDWQTAMESFNVVGGETISIFQKMKDESDDLINKTVELTKEQKKLADTVGNALAAGFSAASQAALEGGDGFAAFGKAAILSIAGVLDALAAQLAAQAVAALLLGNVSGFALGLAGAAAAGLAAGALRAGAGSINTGAVSSTASAASSGNATPAAPTTTTEDAKTSDRSSSSEPRQYKLVIRDREFDAVVQDSLNSGNVSLSKRGIVRQSAIV